MPQTARQIADRLREMGIGESLDFGPVHIFKRDHWWVQAGGGTQLSRTPEAAARKVRAFLGKNPKSPLDTSNQPR